MNVGDREAQRAYLAIAAQSFGGPAAQIAVMHRVIVQEKRWISEDEFLAAMDFCMLLPGPEAQQLATWIGWKLQGLRGALTAGTLFVVPGFVTMLGLAVLAHTWGDVPFVIGPLRGLQAAAVALIAEAVLRIGRRVVVDPTAWVLGGIGLVTMLFTAVPFPVVLLAAAAWGVWETRGQTWAWPGWPDLGPTWRTIGVWTSLWLGPLVALLLLAGPDHPFTQIAGFFAVTASVTFGGAYAVLGWVAEHAASMNWATHAEVAAALALGEVTPGPLIQVVQMVGWWAGARSFVFTNPLWGGVAGSVLTVWMTFVPSFLWILTFAPHLHLLRAFAPLRGAVRRISCVVVGVMAALGVTVLLHVVFRGGEQVDYGWIRAAWPTWDQLDLWSALIVIGSGLALGPLRAPYPWVLTGAAIAGLLQALGTFV